MFIFWTLCRNYLRLRHFVCLGVLSSGACLAQVKRAPANYVPDDDVIVKPIDNEVSLYQQYMAQDQSVDVVKARNQIKVWNDNQIFADQYGMNTTLAGSAYFVPTSDEKWQYFKDKYLRYLRRKGEQPLKDAPKNWYQGYRASNEIDTIDEMENRFQKTNNKTDSGKALPSSLQVKEVSVWKKTKFIFQPRVDQGLIIVGFKSPYAYARAWVGVNGEAEVNVQQSIDSIGFRAMFNYYTGSGRYFTSVDQRIMPGVYARFTANRDPASESRDNSLMLLYGKQF